MEKRYISGASYKIDDETILIVGDSVQASYGVLGEVESIIEMEVFEQNNEVLPDANYELSFGKEPPYDYVLIEPELQSQHKILLKLKYR